MSRFDNLKLQTCLLSSAALPTTDAVIVTALASAPLFVRTAGIELIASDGTSVASLHQPSISTNHTSRGAHSGRSGGTCNICSEDADSATSHTQSFL